MGKAFEYMDGTKYTATWWQILCAKIFGAKKIGNDDGCSITIYYWRGKAYVTKER